MNEFLVAAILALGIARLTLVIVRDDIFQPIRHLVFLSSPPENDVSRGYYYQNYILSTKEERSNKRIQLTVGTNIFERRWTHTDRVNRKEGWWGQVFSCPDCAGVYVSTATLLGYYYLSTATLYVMMVLAASMLTSLIARRY